MKGIFHYRVRALILSGDYVLIQRAKGSSTTFLPGGRVEILEPATEALVREFKEEIGATINVDSFLGVIENAWVQDDGHNCEINLVFSATTSDLSHDIPVISKEDHIEFEWCHVDQLAGKVLLPESLQKFIPEYVAGRRSVLWASDGKWK